VSVTPLLTSATWRRSDATGRPMSATEQRRGAMEPTVAPRGATSRKPPTIGSGRPTIAVGRRTTVGAQGTIAARRVTTGIGQALTA
jgi:hypothetical protein